jgi:predicted dehydrogenase
LDTGTAEGGHIRSNLTEDALGDIFSHIVDLALYLVGEFREVCAATETFVKKRPLKKNARVKGKSRPTTP